MIRATLRILNSLLLLDSLPCGIRCFFFDTSSRDVVSGVIILIENLVKVDFHL